MYNTNLISQPRPSKRYLPSLWGGDPPGGQGRRHWAGDDGVVGGCGVLLRLKEGSHLLQRDVVGIRANSGRQLKVLYTF